MKIYITFGQSHTHRVNGKTLDCNSIACIDAENEAMGRKRAFELFGNKFATSYTESRIDSDFLKYFPRGIIGV